MTVDDRFDLFGMHLQAADVDNSAAAAAEVVAPVAQFENIAGVDEAVGVDERRAVSAEIVPRRARRADAQRAVLDFQIHIVDRVSEVTRRYAREPVFNLESHAGFG